MKVLKEIDDELSNEQEPVAASTKALPAEEEEKPAPNAENDEIVDQSQVNKIMSSTIRDAKNEIVTLKEQIQEVNAEKQSCEEQIIQFKKETKEL